MNGDLVSAVAAHGLLVVVLNVLVDQLGLPVPAVPTLLVAGAFAAGGELPWAPLLVGAVLACCVADALWYLIGQVYGIRVLRLLCRISLEPDSCVSQTQSRFERWGVNSLVIAKFIPGLAVIAPPLAGAMRIGWLRFMALSTVSAILWVGAMLVAGALFKSQIATLLGHAAAIGRAAGVGILTLLAGYVAFKWWERSRFLRSLRMARIGVGELYDLIQAGARPLIVDVRSATARRLDPRRLPGAVDVTLEDAASRLQALPRDREVIVYCSCPSEASAARVARTLLQHGFTRVRPLEGGLEAWAAAGYAVTGDGAEQQNRREGKS